MAQDIPENFVPVVHHQHQQGLHIKARLAAIIPVGAQCVSRFRLPLGSIVSLELPDYEGA
jgi:hypothetical protein